MNTNEQKKSSAKVEIQPIEDDEAAVDFGSDQSFPASDPPALTPVKRPEPGAKKP